ncbi:MAG: hypoxanthine phosphoribosyltransferase [Ruminococcus sp.]|nr:MAG: hypoxanthine phosphoribosyltransferase [Ruminococcus sp.]
MSEEYAGKPLLIIGILKGCYVFLADFCRAIKIPCEIAFMAAESYGQSSVSSGDVKITLDLKCDISKYHVIIAEDIVDTGNTLSKNMQNTEGEKSPFAEGLHPSQQARPQNSGFLRRIIPFSLSPDLFVVGYGLDYGEQMRNLPYIAEAEL